MSSSDAGPSQTPTSNKRLWPSIGARELNGDRIRVPGDRWVPELGRPVRVTLVGTGSLALCIFVLLGALFQVGVVQCAICSGNVCGPGVGVRPDSALSLGLTVALLVGASLMVAVGVSGGEVKMRAVASTLGASSRYPPPSVALLPPFLAFFGGGLVALGWLLPMPRFGSCYYGPCVYPYVLTGYPEALVTGDTVAIASSVALLGVLRFRRQRLGNSGPSDAERPAGTARI